MRATGMARPVDDLGRIVIPKEIRRGFKIKEKDLLEIFIEGHSIILKKAETVCAICGENAETQRIEEKFICKNCIAKISALNDLP